MAAMNLLRNPLPPARPSADRPARALPRGAARGAGMVLHEKSNTCLNGGVTHTFPDDLLAAQRAWYAVYRRLAGTRHTAQTTVLRRELLRLSVRISTHPYWTTLPGGVPAARMELKRAAWSEGAPERGNGPLRESASDPRDTSGTAGGSAPGAA